jgi:uncharacterized protein YhfF
MARRRAGSEAGRPSTAMVATYHRHMPESAEPTSYRGMPAWGFAFPGPLRDELTALALDGTKTATSSLAVDFVVEGVMPARAGDREVILDSAGMPVAIVEITKIALSTIALVDDDFARAEGEGFEDAGDWRAAHERFWTGYIDDLRTGLRDPGFELTDSTVVVCEWFRVVERLDGSS